MSPGFIINYCSVKELTPLQSTEYDSFTIILILTSQKTSKGKLRKIQFLNLKRCKKKCWCYETMGQQCRQPKPIKKNIHTLTLIDMGIMMEQSSSNRRGITNSSYHGPSSG